MIQAGLVTRNTRCNLGGLPCSGFGNKIRISQKRTGHADHISAAIRQHIFGDLRGIDPVGRDDRNTDLAHQFFRHPRKRSAWHGRGDRRNAGLVPADTRVQNRGASGFNGFGQLHYLCPR